MLEFRLPDVGEGMEEAEIVRWLVSAGDVVVADQAVVEIQTDKALVEIPSPSAGRVVSLEGAVGDRVPVGTLLFVLDDGRGREAGAGEAVAADVEKTPAAGGAVPRAGSRRRVKAAPSVRKLATELDVEIAGLRGSGPGGRVLAEDVHAAARSPSPSSAREAPRPKVPDSAPGQAPFGVQPLRGLRRATSEIMQRAWSSIPHIHSFDEIDATPLLEAREALRQRTPEGAPVPGPVAFFVRAAALALRRYPLVNASIDVEGETLTVHEEIHVGIAVATPEGLLVPVVRRADERTFSDLAAEIQRLREAGRARRLRPEELRDGTFTISNYGSLGGRFAAPVIRPPEAAILGFGAIRPRPLVVDGEVRARPTLPICFGADHRLIDGDLSEAFQAEVKALLANPVLLFAGV